jgi:hypothetical protein
MEQQNHELDNLLAQLTDDVLADQDVVGGDSQNPDLRVIRVMKDLTSGTPSPEFRARLTDVLNREWDAMQHDKRRTTTVAAWYNRPSTRLVALAAALVIVVGLLAVYGSTTGGNTSGTVIGDAGTVAIVIGILIGVGVIAAIWSNRRGQ